MYFKTKLLTEMESHKANAFPNLQQTVCSASYIWQKLFFLIKKQHYTYSNTVIKLNRKNNNLNWAYKKYIIFWNIKFKQSLLMSPTVQQLQLLHFTDFQNSLTFYFNLMGWSFLMIDTGQQGRSKTSSQVNWPQTNGFVPVILSPISSQWFHHKVRVWARWLWG